MMEGLWGTNHISAMSMLLPHSGEFSFSAACYTSIRSCTTSLLSSNSSMLSLKIGSFL